VTYSARRSFQPSLTLWLVKSEGRLFFYGLRRTVSAEFAKVTYSDRRSFQPSLKLWLVKSEGGHFFLWASADTVRFSSHMGDKNPWNVC
jgi:hypothetical protein